MSFRFENPWLLLALMLPIAVLWLRPSRGGAEFGAFALARMALTPSRGPKLLRLLTAAALACLVLAAARPQFGRTVVERDQSGRDLMLVIDLSLSMKVDDVAGIDGQRGDRLAAVMAAAKRFVAKRPNDRFGLVFFASSALTSCPLTYDHRTVADFIDRTERQQRLAWERAIGEQIGLLGDGTNLGLGLGSALRFLDRDDGKGKAIVLITDGRDSQNLPNWIDPVIAARHAAQRRVPVHCVGVGRRGGTMTFQDRAGRVHTEPVPTRLLPDPARLQEIAGAAKGRALEAGDEAGLDAVLAEIDALEETPRTLRTRADYADRFALPLALGVALALLAFVCEPRLRGIP